MVVIWWINISTKSGTKIRWGMLYVTILTTKCFNKKWLAYQHYLYVSRHRIVKMLETNKKSTQSMSIYRGETRQRLFEVWKLSSGNIRKVWATFVGERQWGSNLNVGMHRAIQRRDLQEQSSGHRGVFSPQMHECLRTPLLFFLLSDPCVMSIVGIIHISHSQRIVSCV